MLNAEDTHDSIILPRQRAAKADMEKVVAIPSVATFDANGEIEVEVEVSLKDDIDTIAVALDEFKDVGLIIIDPISAYLGKTDSHNNSEVRGVLAPLARMAADRNVAILCVSHLNKSGDNKAVYRITGSLAFGAASRMVLLVGPHPEDNTGKRRVLIPVKSDIAQLGGGQEFTIRAETVWAGSPPHSVETSLVRWGGRVTGVDADDVLKAATPKRRTVTDEASDWLAGKMKPDSRYDVDDLEEEAKANGFSDKVLRTARTVLGVKTVKKGFDKGWCWVWPSAAAEAYGHGRSIPPDDEGRPL